MALTKIKSGVTAADILKVINDATALSAAPAAADLLPIYDASASAEKKITIEELYQAITNLTDLAAGPAAADEVAIYDASGSVVRKVSLTNLFAGINNLTEDTNPALTTDFVVTYDASATTAKKVTLANTGIFSESFTSADQTITNAGSLTIAHGLSNTPTLVQLRFKCLTAQHNYAVNDEVITDNHHADTGSYGVSCVPDGTNLNIRFGSSGQRILDKTTGVTGTLTNVNWALIVKAWA